MTFDHVPLTWNPTDSYLFPVPHRVWPEIHVVMWTRVFQLEDSDRNILAFFGTLGPRAPIRRCDRSPRGSDIHPPTGMSTDKPHQFQPSVR